ncbi:tRNA (5-methylaminomethyl-2-thiouridine)(34)-methyltransferase MnmD [Mangrovimonas aestuarii]|uniref:tRNA (5-methylaminomethyl-2-thiouridine)(34)-methyltransferase MnmD n=1 Tax=Mangrovimonas aestuarii TaxID=3018443 RepID=UPI002378E99B|nr:tRNA (5-methylaminomethyl-2-thiouridine)(34)-methyltransferase MnmD [Mangrovimonas aestuarii]
MERKIITTADGSKTIYIPEWNEHYHSKHGAIQEAYHVFVEYGLRYFLETNKPKQDLNILEIGFGTGLNAFITLLESIRDGFAVNYTGVEAFPVSLEQALAMDYPKELNVDEVQNLFVKLHETQWEETAEITSIFSLHKRELKFEEITDETKYDLVYFDAFGARVQPELWTEDIFEIMYKALKNSGVLVTYSAKGSVRRAMQSVGFTVERLPGPPGKREMLRATKS